MIPRHLLPVVLDRYFPVIEGPDDLDRVPALLEPRPDEFVACLRTDPEMVAQTCRSGYLPMSEDFTGHEILLVKAHAERCVLDFPDLHYSKSTRRRARDLEIRVDADFDRCLAATVAHHPDRWLTESLCGTMSELHRAPLHGVQFRSVELYRGERLVAGEVGYTCGLAYTSMSGFYRESGAGSVQLATLGRLLDAAGFAFWDLGMAIEYKFQLGARLVDRDRFLARYREAATEPAPALPDVAACGSLLGYSSTG